MDNQLAFFEDDGQDFEKLSHQNGNLYWLASTLMEALGYGEFKTTAQPILKASQVCTNSGIDHREHFISCDTERDGRRFRDIKLTRFACYLVVMNADVKKPNVAKAQAYFAAFTSAVQEYFVEHEDMERIDLRGQLSEHEKAMSSTAKQYGVRNFALFQNSGYMGLYNMPLSRLRAIKGVPKERTPFDFMGREELGANIFRVTQTEAKIKRENITGQKSLENAAYSVGRMVRNVLKENGSTLPEELPTAQDIKLIKGDLKRTNRAFDKRDRIKKPLPDGE